MAGCAAAHVISEKSGWDVTLVERSSALGAGVRTMWYGGHPYTFGPRHFLTKNENVFEFFNSYCPLRRCQDHVFFSFVEKDQNFYNYPIHRDDISRMPESKQIEQELSSCNELGALQAANNLEEYWISSVGPTLYDKFVKHYSHKMWQLNDNSKIDDFNWSPKGVALKEGPKEAWDEAISAYPYAANGYDDYFEIATEKATVLLNTSIDSYDIDKKTVWIDGEKLEFDVIVNTISPDELFDNCFGQLPYIGRQFYKFVLPVQFAFPENVYFLYYTGDEPFTRIVEYKKFTRQRYEDDTTILGLEIPVIDGGKHYPLPFKSEIQKAKKYFDLMPEGVFSIGRAGCYQYGYDIDDCIESALDIGQKI